MKNKTKWLLLAILMVLSLFVFVACSDGDAEQSSSENQDSNSNETSETTVELIYASGYPETHPQVGVLAEEWIEKVYEATEGRVQIRGIHGGALLSGEDMVDGLQNQTTDIGSLVISFWPGHFKATTSLAGVVDLSVGDKVDIQGISEITNQLFEEFPEFNEEFQKQNLTPLFWVPTPPYAIIATEEWSELSEFKGKKIRPLGSNIPLLFEAAGAVPVQVDAGEIYTGLQTGVIDGAMTDPANMVANNYSEVAKYLIKLGSGSGGITSVAPVFYAISNDSLEKLSEKDKEILFEVSREMIVHSADKMKEEEEKALKKLEEDGVKIQIMSQEDIDKWIELSPDWFGMLEENLNSEGLPGTEISNRYQELFEEYKVR